MAEPINHSGCLLYIGGALASKATDFILSDFDGQIWTLIDGTTKVGALGDVAAVTTEPVVNRGRDVKLVGTKNSGTLEEEILDLPADPGQILARSRIGTKQSYAFRRVLPFSPTVTEYFVGLVTSFPRSGGGANDAMKVNLVIEANSNIVTV